VSVQTTLLGIAIAVIVALVTALVGPLLVDWGRYRTEFETAASRLTGQPVRVAGSIDARILPTPTLILHDLEFGDGAGGRLRARALHVEFALGALMRGEWRAAELRLQGAELSLGLDGNGRLDWRPPAMAVDPDAVSIQQLHVDDGRIVLSDAASGASLELDQVAFAGEVRSLAGPVKGEGSFVIDGQRFPYRLSAGRPGEDGTVRLRLAVDSTTRPLTAEADAAVSMENGAPQFDGTVQLSRAVTRAAEGDALITEPWHVLSHVKGNPAAAVLQQVELQYGPDDRAIKLRGDARVSFGRQPHMDGVLSSIQVDLDRLLALPEAERRRPLAAIRALADAFAEAPALPLPMQLGLSVETVTLAGAPLQRLSGDIRIDSGMLDIQSLDLRVPGLTQVRLSGRLSAAPAGAVFAGPIKIETADPRGFAAWLADRSVAEAIAATPLRASGEMKIGSGAITVDHLTATIDRTKLEGRLAYAWASEDRPARLDAAFSSRDVDLDRVVALGRGLIAGGGFERPREGSLALKIGRAAFAGVEAKRADINVKLDRNGLDIERFAVGDFGGTALSVIGRIDTRSGAPRGAVVLDLDARTLGGISALAEKFAPAGTLASVRRATTRFAPAKLHAALSIDGDAAVPATAKFKLDGNAGPFRLDLQGETGVGDGTRKLALAGHVDANDGSALAELVGIDRLVVVDKHAGRLTLSANGPLDGELGVEGQLVAGGLDVATSGSLRLFGAQDANAGLSLKVAVANLRSPRPPAAGRVETLPLSLDARMVLADNTVSLTQISGTLADAPVSGRLRIGTSEPPSVAGEIEIGAVDLPAVLGAALGMPASSSGANTNTNAWSAEPFDAGLLGRVLGRVVVKSPRVALARSLAAQNVRAVVSFDSAGLSIDDIDGALAGGRISGGIMLQRKDETVTARSQLRIAGAAAAALIAVDRPSGAAPPVAGGLTLDVTLDGSGRSPVALLGAVQGSGSFVLQDGRLATLDPAAFDAVIRAVDSGLPIDAAHIGERMDKALSGGVLPVPLAEGSIGIADGQLRLLNTAVHAQGAELAVNAGVNLVESALDARLVLSRPVATVAAPDASVPAAATLASVARAGNAPQVIIALKGPIAAPKRTVEANALASWLALRAVDQQAKRLDALQGGREAAVPPAASPSDASAPNATSTTQPASRAKPVVVPRPKPVQPGPTADQLPPLPPPIDIRPAPAPRPQRTTPAKPAVPPAASGAASISVGP
jgi:uncharacterized protein involved in outer membrane biogenesis